jgi:hypothetical protein
MNMNIDGLLRFRTNLLLKLQRKIHVYSKLKNENELKHPLAIYYRISDTGYAKTKPPYINNENCLRNAVKCFPIEKCKWIIIADNCSNETMQMIKKYVPEQVIHAVSIGNGAGTFRLVYQMALELDESTPVYFLENDYLHVSGSHETLLDGLSQPYSYVTLYDHPDKYDNAHFAVKNGGEKTRVLVGKYSHWKIAHSTTMTFASMVKTLKQDWAIFDRWTQTKHPYDCQMFIELARKKHKLISPLPAFSTHGETAFLAPLVEWDRVAFESCV